MKSCPACSGPLKTHPETFFGVHAYCLACGRGYFADLEIGVRHAGEPEPFICEGCGKHEALEWCDSARERLWITRLCHRCDHWHVKYLDRDNPTRVRVAGTHYRIYPPSDGFQGFGGSKFIIAFHDGRRQETRNLWCQGTLPDHYRDVLPDNAVFVSEHVALEI